MSKNYKNNYIFSKIGRLSDVVEKETISVNEDNSVDGRLESINSESDIIDIVSFHPDVTTKNKNRSFGDFYYEGKPVNIKITTGKSADDVFTTKHLNYVLFGEQKGISKNKLAKKINLVYKNDKGFCDNAIDYYYFVYIKGEHKCFVGSMFSLNEDSIYLNPTNMGQVKWLDYSYIDRDLDEAQNFIAKIYHHYTKKISEPNKRMKDVPKSWTEDNT